MFTFGMISAGGRARVFIFMHAQMAKHPASRMRAITQATDAINNMGIFSENELFKTSLE